MNTPRHAAQRLLKAILLLTTIALCAFGTASAQQLTDSYAPESGSHGFVAQDSAMQQAKIAKEFIAVTAHPLATEAAYAVLSSGGNAIDAMVTVQTVLGLVEPQSSGLGGGAFLLYYDAEKDTLSSFDGRETAPTSSSDTLFLNEKMQPMKFFDAVVGGRSVGTPGTVKLLSEVHKRYGSIDWKKLLAPGIEMASQGFTVTPRLAASVSRDRNFLLANPSTADYFFPKGKAISSGQTLTNPEYADTLVSLSKHGGEHFYNSDISQAIVSAVSKHSNPGFLSQADFEKYRIIERPAVCHPYRQYDICGMGPPSSGAITVSQTLALVEPFELHTRSGKDPVSWQIIADASRLAFADRGLYLADPDYFSVPAGLLDQAYLKKRAKLITPGKALPKVAPGDMQQHYSQQLSTGTSPSQASTSHFVIADKYGNIVSMTSTIENGFGSRLMVKGFLLNNELTDFSFKAKNDQGLIANRVEAGKRPRSSMAPTIVFTREADKRKPYMALGSPGGSRIINYVSNSLIATLDWQMPLQAAFNQAHIINRFGTLDIEANSNAVHFAKDFEAMGYKVNLRELNSGLHGVLFTEDGYQGAADPRREGSVMGR
jgi:gamma-glutamyltranspeptidase / glutathione hydrolase